MSPFLYSLTLLLRSRASVWMFVLLLVIIGLAVSAAAVEQLPLAVPGAVAADWAKNPHGSLAAVLADNERLGKLIQEYQALGSWIAWAGGAVTLILGLARMFPGPTQAIAEVLYGFWATRQSKAQEEKRDVMAKGFVEVAAIMRTFPRGTALGDVVDKLNSHLPEDVKQAYRDWERNEAGPRPDARSAPAVVSALPVKG
jgi:hypothetical protein